MGFADTRDLTSSLITAGLPEYMLSFVRWFPADRVSALVANIVSLHGKCALLHHLGTASAPDIFAGRPELLRAFLRLTTSANSFPCLSPGIHSAGLMPGLPGARYSGSRAGRFPACVGLGGSALAAGGEQAPARRQIAGPHAAARPRNWLTGSIWWLSRFCLCRLLFWESHW